MLVLAWIILVISVIMSLYSFINMFLGENITNRISNFIAMIVYIGIIILALHVIGII